MWPWPLTYLNKYFKRHFCSLRITTVPNYSEIHEQMYKLWPRQIWTGTCTMHAHTPNWICNNHLIIWPPRVTLTSTLPQQLFQMAMLLLKENNCQIILKSMHKCRSYGPDKSWRTHACMHTHGAEIETTCLAHLKRARQKLFRYIITGKLLSIVFKIAIHQYTKGLHMYTYIYLWQYVNLPHPFVFMCELDLETLIKTTMTIFLWAHLKRMLLSTIFSLLAPFIFQATSVYTMILDKTTKNYPNVWRIKLYLSICSFCIKIVSLRQSGIFLSILLQTAILWYTQNGHIY